jgi:hypothetical protein
MLRKRNKPYRDGHTDKVTDAPFLQAYIVNPYCQKKCNDKDLVLSPAKPIRESNRSTSKRTYQTHGKIYNARERIALKSIVDDSAHTSTD